MAHAKLSPSSAVRWMTCPGSGVMSAGLPERRSMPAARGTVAHAIADAVLTDEADPASFLGQVWWVTSEGDFVDAEAPGAIKVVVDQAIIDQVVTYTTNFLKYVEAVGPRNGDHWIVEYAVPIGEFTGEEGARGTADGIVFAPRQLQVHDFKSGWHEVDPVENKQCMLYALGALEVFGRIDDFDEVLIVIHQPEHGEPKEWLTTPERLREFADEVRESAHGVLLAETHHAEGVDPATWREKYLAPSDEGCKFCPARATCPALKAQVDAAVATEFEDLTVAKSVGAEDLGAAMRMVERVEVWAKAVRAEVERRLLARQGVPGFKLVLGRRGARKWKSKDVAETILTTALGEEAYEKELISPAEAEKRLKKERPLTWKEVSEQITQSDGKPSVAPESDKREPYTPGATADEFDVVTEE